MASSCNRFVFKSSLSSIKSAIRSYAPKPPTARSPPLLSKTCSSPCRPFSSFSRPPPELGCLQSLLPLHSAVAAVRMTSCLSTTSRSCRALSQEFGLSVPR